MGPAGLLALHSRLPVSPACLLEAAALHLDVADEHSPSAVQAWTALAQTLNDAAKRLSDLQVRWPYNLYPIAQHASLTIYIMIQLKMIVTEMGFLHRLGARNDTLRLSGVTLQVCDIASVVHPNHYSQSLMHVGACDRFELVFGTLK